jgi:hypothetical protein
MVLISDFRADDGILIVSACSGFLRFKLVDLVRWEGDTGAKRLVTGESASTKERGGEGRLTWSSINKYQCWLPFPVLVTKPTLSSWFGCGRWRGG